MRGSPARLRTTRRKETRGAGARLRLGEWSREDRRAVAERACAPGARPGGRAGRGKEECGPPRAAGDGADWLRGGRDICAGFCSLRVWGGWRPLVEAQLPLRKGRVHRRIYPASSGRGGGDCPSSSGPEQAAEVSRSPTESSVTGNPRPGSPSRKRGGKGPERGRPWGQIRAGQAERH